MRNLTIIAVLLAVVIGVIGLTQGWCDLTTTHKAGSSKVDVHLKVDTDTAKSDAKEVSHIQ